LKVIISSDLGDEVPLGELRKRVFEILPEEDIIRASELLEAQNISKDEEKWLMYDKHFPKISRNIRHIFKVLAIDSNNSWQEEQKQTDRLLETTSFLKNHWRNKKEYPIEDLPTEVFTDKLLFTQSETGNKPNLRRVEIQLYKSIRKNLRSNNLHLSDSFEYRSLEDDLIAKDSFEKEKKQLFESISLPVLETEFYQLVNEKLNLLDESILLTNKNILADDNEFFIKNTNNDTWHIQYESLPDPNIDNNIFKKHGKIELIELFREVDKKTNVLSSFHHLLMRYSKSSIEKDSLIATIIAYGTNLGLYKMAECSPFSYAKLKEVSDNFVSLQNLKEASQIIINDTTTHKTTNYYDLGNLVHSSSDGQKFLSAIDTFNAVSSPKYYGMGKGISVISLNANYVPLGLKIVSSNEYEGNYILELLLMNDSDLQSKVHSTDMHGITDINFALLDLCGYSFAPRFTNISSRTANLSSSCNPEDFPADFVIKPSNQIDKELILSEKENIQRIVLSIMKKSSQVSTIVKKLNHSPKSNKTRKALAEYDKLIRSTYIMNYINDSKFRRHVQTALNRGEGYHQLVRAIGFANGGKNIADSLQEQYLYKESNRLIANMIINFNSSILSSFISEKTKLKDYHELDEVKRISPVAWSAVNMYGQYRFDNKKAIVTDAKLKKKLKDESIVKKSKL
jgi:TnpA family transposase